LPAPRSADFNLFSEMEFTFTLDQIDFAAAEILAANPRKVVLFDGEMGAGKTTLIKALAARLGVRGMTASPTFSLVNEYETDRGEPLYHFDVYRLKSQEEALDMGIEEYLYSGNWCFIEWPGKIPDLIPDGHSRIAISALPDGARRVSLTV
jgi:tRNA threonylcarbamoyladenosine biosynthesis protein TsaE